MARKASDVLAVHLLLKEAGCPYVLPVAPLFETLDDLNAGPAVIETLFNEPWYKNHVKNQQHVMIGYSDEKPVINPEEVEAWKWMAIDEVKNDMQTHVVYNQKFLC